ncbi:hypothetical protein [Streptococcus uberis]|uniref:hypothetical protein n=2 Tax=Streptococcus uberis TaxID=1349 RepID=UPI001939C2F3|nr:hypothetical protein [Streptococcus uberis]
MKKQTIIYCYRMTHDYGINPCVFTEEYEPTPRLLTEGGCMIQLRRNLRKNWADRINSGEIDAYVMAVAGHSNDGGSWRDDQGSFISPKYNHLIFVAKISKVDSIKNYLKSDSSMNRRDAYTYNYCIDHECWNPKTVNDPIIISEKFKYFGKSPLELPPKILDFFPMGRRAMLTGKTFPRWNTKNGFYNSEERPEDTLELRQFITELLGEENEIVDLPYHPFYIRGEN